MRILTCLLAILIAGCSKSVPPVESGAYRIYVTNETSGDMSVIDSAKMEVVATVPLGKRPRGIHASPDRKTIYVALSGSPIAGPDVDESTLPPPDKNADGIGVFDVAQNKLVKLIKSGSDPENFDLSKDGKLLYVSNDHESLISVFKEASLQSRLDYVDLSVMSVEDDSFTCGYLFSRSLWKVSRM